MDAYVDPRGLAKRYEPVIRALRPGPVDLDDEALTVSREGRLRMVYVPFDLVRPAAQVVLVGLTPGAFQARMALCAARDAYAAGAGIVGAQLASKNTAAFAGPLRANLIGMLDAVGLPRCLGLQSSAEVFAEAGSLVHTTSALRYAVFQDGRNYSGHGRAPAASPMLCEVLVDLLAPELATVPDALVIPLGAPAASCLWWLAEQGLVDSARCLTGFPHPSGANRHRVARFAAERQRLAQRVGEWFSGG